MNHTKESLYKWLKNLPPDSIARLRQINLSASSSRHIILTLAYGVYDRHIRKLNGIITGLLLARLKAERSGRDATISRINKVMEDIHLAIDQVTDTAHPKNGGACNRSGRKRA